MSSPIRFSIVIACYNMENYIEECLNSILRQDYDEANFEVICVDDGSTDRSPEIIAKLAKGSSNLKTFRTENSGLEKTCNYGVERSSNPWIIRVDADDFLELDYLSTFAAAMEKNPGYSFYYTRSYVEYYSAERNFEKELPAFDPEEIFCRGDFFATGTAYRKDLLQQIGGFPTAVKNCGLENYSVILALLTKGHKGFGIKGTSFSYRRHETNMSLVKLQAIIEFGKKLLEGYGRVFQTNNYHPYGLKLTPETTKR